ncbi:MAG: polyprenyl synthetase family protein [bacterium]
MGANKLVEKKKGLPDLVQLTLGDRIKRLEDKITKLLDIDNPLLSQIATYICMSKGKRIRPIFLFLCSSLGGYKGDGDIFVGTIVEFIHAATLLHDDVIDQSPLRRGKASANSKWGDRLPILVGDYLFAKSFFWLVENKQYEIMAAVSSATASLTNGEILQLRKMGRMDVSEELYLDIIGEKTAFFISMCCKIGGILGGLSDSLLDKVTDFGMDVGMAFQLVDDALDFIADEKKLGKPVVNDFREGNCTLPLIYSLKMAQPEEKIETERISKKKFFDNDDIQWILSLVDKYRGTHYTFDKARSYIARAKEKLSAFDHSTSLQALLDLADYIVERDY